jgi:ferric-dicitrate binding protein FerR (iron transport regulator)
MSLNQISEDLIARYLSGEVTGGEIRQVESWAEESENNAIILEQYRKLWLLTENAEAPEIDIEKAWLKTKLRMQESIDYKNDAEIIPIKKTTNFPFLKIAAGISVLLVLSSLIYLLNNQENAISYVAGNKQLEVYLPDSSKIILEPNSVLSLIESEYNKESRNVELSGLAYFDVIRNESSPFIISVSKSQVQVLGTSFRIKQNSNSVEVAVITGKVELRSKEEGAKQIITAGTEGILNETDNKISVDSISIEEIGYQLHRTLIFEETDLKKVCETLRGIFHVDVALSTSSQESCLLTATFKNQSLNEILEIIASTFTLELKESDQGYALYGNGCD